MCYKIGSECYSSKSALKLVQNVYIQFLSIDSAQNLLWNWFRSKIGVTIVDFIVKNWVRLLKISIVVFLVV